MIDITGDSSTEVVSTIVRMRECLAHARQRKKLIGCVPTMGSLHAGHAALIESARAETNLVVVTIFVNPIQFDRPDDHKRYARQLAADRRFCQTRGVDLVFAPFFEEMYPQPIDTFVDALEMSRHLCGKIRPGHFRGVGTVVAKLFNIIQPDIAYFGEKDAQQLAIIQQMVGDLNFPVRIARVATVREPDGLAISSRNQRLSVWERPVAPIVFQALSEGRRLIAAGELDARRVKAGMLLFLQREIGCRVEYAEVVDSRMQPVVQVVSGVRLVAAVWVGNTRLIDNVPALD